MQVTENFGTNQHLISAYGKGYIKVNKQEYRQNLILTPAKIIKNWCDCGPEALEVEHFSPLDSSDLELIILGTGSRLVFLPPPLMQYFLYKRIGFEVMDLGAACRTYNVLLSEGRQVAAALLLA